MDLSDRLLRGFIAGMVGGIVQDILDVISNLIKIDELTYFDWAGIVIFGSRPNNLLEYIVAVFSQIFLVGLLGIIFAYLIPQVTSKNLILKGGIFGLTVWSVFFVTILIFKIEKLMETQADSAASDAITSVIFGIVVSLTLQWLEKSQKYES